MKRPYFFIPAQLYSLLPYSVSQSFFQPRLGHLDRHIARSFCSIAPPIGSCARRRLLHSYSSGIRTTTITFQTVSNASERRTVRHSCSYFSRCNMLFQSGYGRRFTADQAWIYRAVSRSPGQALGMEIASQLSSDTLTQWMITGKGRLGLIQRPNLAVPLVPVGPGTPIWHTKRSLHDMCRARHAFPRRRAREAAIF